MRRNLLLVVAVVVAVFVGVNSFKKILSFRGTSKEVEQEQAQLAKLKSENEALKQELEYKKSQRFVEGEIRNKLGLAKEGEEIVVIPKKEDDGQQQNISNKKQVPNWKKWRNLFLGRG